MRIILKNNSQIVLKYPLYLYTIKMRKMLPITFKIFLDIIVKKSLTLLIEGTVISVVSEKRIKNLKKLYTLSYIVIIKKEIATGSSCIN